MEKKKTKSTVFLLGRMHRREVHASQLRGLLSSRIVLQREPYDYSKLRDHRTRYRTCVYTI